MRELEKKGLRCVAYARLSSRELAERSEFTSIEAQIEACKAYVKSQGILGWKFLKAYTDLSTGADVERPGLQQMLQDARDGMFDCIVCVKIDRLSRSLHDFFELHDLFDEKNIKFVCTTQDINTTNAAGRMFLKILVSFGEYERELIVERVKAKLHETARQGLFCGGYIPLGYHSPEKGRPLQIEEREAGIVRLIFSLYEKHHSVIPVVRELEKQGQKTKMQKMGEKTRGGIPFQRSSVLRILRNPLYIGEYSFRGNRTPMPITPIIPRPQFERIQKMLDLHTRGDGFSRTKYPYLLKGILRCGCCGGAMIAAPGKKSRFFYYRCVGVPKKGVEVCELRNLPAPQIEEKVVEIISCTAQDEEKLRSAVSLTQQEESRKREILEGALTKEEVRREELIQTTGRLIEIIEKGQCKINVLEERLNTLGEEKAHAEEAIQEIKKQLGKYGRKEIDFLHLRDSLRIFIRAMGSKKEEKRKEAVRNLIDRVFVEKNYIRVSVRARYLEGGSGLEGLRMRGDNLLGTTIWINSLYTWKKGFRGKKEVKLL